MPLGATSALTATHGTRSKGLVRRPVVGYRDTSHRLTGSGGFAMRVPCLVVMIGALSVAIVVPSAAGQSGKWTAPRTPDGKPDIQGTFTFSTITPLQRPEALANKDVLTAAEAAAFEAGENRRQNRDLFDPEKGAPGLGYPPRSEGGVLSYNEFWYERG